MLVIVLGEKNNAFAYLHFIISILFNLIQVLLYLTVIS